MKMQTPVMCVHIKESMTIKKVLFVKDADKHALGWNNVNDISQITNAPVNQTKKTQT